MQQLLEGDALPVPGVYVGRPTPPGRRVILLLLNASTGKSIVVKAGHGDRARELIRHERTFLEMAPRPTAGIPRLRSVFESADVSAFAVDLVEGETPRDSRPSVAEPLLTAWVERSQTMPIGSLRQWSMVAGRLKASERLRPIAADLASRQVHPAIYHGDFAPWNLRKASDGELIAVDWERGELAGMPTWDWFHYAVYVGALTERRPIPALVTKLESVLSSAALRRYSEASGVVGVERQLLIAYLVHSLHEVQRTEAGRTRTRALIDALNDH